MNIIPFDNFNNLFLIENLVSESLLNKITSTPWLNFNYIDWKPGYKFRRTIELSNEIVEWQDEWNDTIFSIWDQLQRQLNVNLQEFRHNDTKWWVDAPGFKTSIHLDNASVLAAMQMYWQGGSEFGTTFYGPTTDPTNNAPVRYQTTAIPNTGYIMINGPDQWHGTTLQLPENTLRVTSYTLLPLLNAI